MRFFTLLLSLFCFSMIGIAQSPLLNAQEAKEKLAKKDISDAELKKRMLEKGYDLDNISPEQSADLQTVLEETIKEIETEKKESIISQPTESKEIVDKTSDSTEDEKISPVLTPVNKSAVSIYGQSAFRDKSLNVFQTGANVKPPNSYVLGPGDKLTVSIWGRSQAEFAFTINDEGFIKPTNMARIALKGQTLAQATELLRQRFAQYYIFDKEQFSLTISAARTITVNIFGEAENYGSYTISAINTALNALVVAGGPTDIGSLRNIKVINSRKTKTLDVYQFLSNPKIQFDFFLENNDVIHIPVSEKVVEIKGQVNRPLKYELTQNENLADLIKYAGNLKANASAQKLSIKRLVDGQKTIIDVDFTTAAGKAFKLQNGDEVEVRDSPGRLEYFTGINGAVEYPGEYALEKDMRISNLLKSGQLREDARLDLAFLDRQMPDGTSRLIRLDISSILEKEGSQADIKLEAKDRLTIFSKTRFTDQYNVSVAGAVRAAGSFAYSPDLRITDLINLAGGLTPTAMDFAYILRGKPNNPDAIEYVRVDLQKAINEPDAAANLTLEPQDRLNIMASTQFTDVSYVKVQGAVRNPGEYQYDSSLDMKNILTMAGGLKLGAASNQIDIYRLVFNKNESTKTIAATIEVDADLNVVSGESIALQPFDIIIVRNLPDFELQKTVTIEGEVKFPGTYALIDKNERILSLIQRAGGITEEAFLAGADLYRSQDNLGRVILELEKVMKNPNSRFNYIVKEQDVITIPKNKDLVTVNLSATLANELFPERFSTEKQVSVAYNEGKRAKWYLDEYTGGISKRVKARKRFITVDYPNGEFKRSKGFLFLRSTPLIKKGSVVHVGVKPPKPPKPKKGDKEEVDWNKAIANALALAASAFTVVILAGRVNQ